VERPAKASNVAKALAPPANARDGPITHLGYMADVTTLYIYCVAADNFAQSGN
jgi:hypothetical protein